MGHVVVQVGTHRRRMLPQDEIGRNRDVAIGTTPEFLARGGRGETMSPGLPSRGSISLIKRSSTALDLLSAGADEFAQGFLGLRRVVRGEGDVDVAPDHAGRERGLDVDTGLRQPSGNLSKGTRPVDE